VASGEVGEASVVAAGVSVDAASSAMEAAGPLDDQLVDLGLQRLDLHLEGAHGGELRLQAVAGDLVRQHQLPHPTSERGEGGLLTPLREAPGALDPGAFK